MEVTTERENGHKPVGPEVADYVAQKQDAQPLHFISNTTTAFRTLLKNFTKQYTVMQTIKGYFAKSPPPPPPRVELHSAVAQERRAMFEARQMERRALMQEDVDDIESQEPQHHGFFSRWHGSSEGKHICVLSACSWIGLG